MTRPAPKLVLAGAIVLALGLSGCGRKGPLELPPGASVEPAPAPGPDGAPVRRDRFVLDPLLN